ncbi:hypothetical protein PG996_014896 [Apiospora saccharicola]|uniref:Uncharacterized protein n=1 Tax=Apiospora saccharicola TaxID=335842 RepID=A0ABR1TJR9_9PEZI
MPHPLETARAQNSKGVLLQRKLGETFHHCPPQRVSNRTRLTSKTQYLQDQTLLVLLMLQASGPIWRSGPVRHVAEAAYAPHSTGTLYCTLSSFVGALDKFRVAVGALARKRTTEKQPRLFVI